MRLLFTKFKKHLTSQNFVLSFTCSKLVCLFNIPKNTKITMTYQVVPHSLFSEFDIHLFREGKHFKLYEKWVLIK